jgi:uncharacterized membrane protein
MGIRSGLLAGYPPAVKEALLYGFVLVVLVVLLGAVVLWARKRSLTGGGRQADNAFSIEDLEQMRRDGKITDEQFRHLRRVTLGLHQAGGEEQEKSSENQANCSLSAPPLQDDSCS